MTDDLDRRLARLEAVHDIRRLKLAYGALCDAGYPPDELAGMFTEDGVWDGGETFGVHRGRPAVHAFFSAIAAEVGFALHFMIGDSIEVAGDAMSARGSWQMLELATMIVDGTPHAMWLAAIYEDEYRKEADGRWRFASVRLHWRLQARHADGWAGERLQL